MLFVGPIDRGVSFAVDKAVRDAGGTVVRTRSIGVPIDTKAVQEALRRRPAFHRLSGARPARRARHRSRGRARGGRSDAALGRARRADRAGARRPVDAAGRRARRRSHRRAAARCDQGVPRGRLRRACTFGRAGSRHRGIRNDPERDPGVHPRRSLDRRLGRHLGRAHSGSCCFSAAPSPAATASARLPRTACSRRYLPLPSPG